MRVRLVALALLTMIATAQDPGASTSTQTGASQAQQSSSTESSRAKTGGKSVLLSTAFTPEIAEYVLGEIQQGMVARNPRRILAVFDKKSFEGYETFQDQLDVLFERYETIRVAYRTVSTAAERDRATVVVEFEVEEVGTGGAYPPVRKQQQVKFALQRTKEGWRVADYMPRGFFA